MGILLHHLLADSASRRPEAVAVRFQDQSLTYGALDERSNHLAHALVAAGVQPGDRVGLHLRKSPAAIIGIFGILKAGACYVPLDSNAPGARLADIAAQCQMRCLLTSAGAWARVGPDFACLPELEAVFFAGLPAEPGPFAGRSYDLDQTLAGRRPDAPARDGIDRDLAYVLFTSGSTGRPKGVMLSHLNALTFVKWACDTFALTCEDRLSNHAPFIFDLSILDIFAGIKAGAAISLVPEGLSTVPAHLSQFIEAQRITVWYSVPSVLTLLLLHGRLADRDLRDLRLILFAGEVFPVKYLRSLMRAVPHARYFNLYGPTETNVCTYYEVTAIPEEQARPIPIGKACVNTDVFAINEQGQKVERPGQEGLLYARGSIVMQGYYGRPGETDAAFIANPFAHGRDEKLYCTGDLVTLDEDGNYVFLGRKDHMIKTRGYRVELNEIEAALYGHPGVLEAVALAVPNEQFGSTIKAFVVRTSGATVDEQDVKRHCARSLPRYMVPETVEFRSALPRTATDKVDRPRLVAESLAVGR